MADQNKNQENKENKKENDSAKDIDARMKINPETDDRPSREGGINTVSGVPNKGGRHGNASVEDGGNTEGNSAGSH